MTSVLRFNHTINLILNGRCNGIWRNAKVSSLSRHLPQPLPDSKF